MAKAKQPKAYLPLLKLQDGQRALENNNDPRHLLDFIDSSPSAWARFEARRSLAAHYAMDGDWRQYDEIEEYAGPCTRLLHAVFQRPELVTGAAAVAIEEGSPKDRVCFAAFNAATAAGFLRDRDVWRMIRALVGERKTSTARFLLRLLKEDKASARDLNKAVQNATTRIKGKHPLDTRVGQELLAVSAVVAAQRDPRLAAKRWVDFSPYVDKDISDHVWPIIGMWAALDHFPEALSYFRRSPLEAGADYALRSHGRFPLAWRARAAMRAGQWEEVKRTIEAMKGEQPTLSAWRYWHAHASYLLGDRAGALNAWRAIAVEFDDYYGLIAAGHVNAPERGASSRQPSPELLERLASDADVKLAIALGVNGRTTQARRVWKFLHQTYSSEELLAAAKLAEDAGWLLGSINAAEAAGPDSLNYELRFPLVRSSQIQSLSSRFGLSEPFVYSLIRRESRFDPKAVSSAGARGLMQVMPATARAVARRHKYTRYNNSRLTIPEVNLLIGTRYLADLNAAYDGDLVLLAAAYNAGPHRVRKWLRSSKGINRLVFVETIPFTETRLYVKDILGTKQHYARMLNSPTEPLGELLAKRYS